MQHKGKIKTRITLKIDVNIIDDFLDMGADILQIVPVLLRRVNNAYGSMESLDKI